MATIWPQVTMPPPPIPANRPRQTSSNAGVGSGNSAESAASRACQIEAWSITGGGAAALEVTKLGQKPLRHDRSVLQLVGLMRRLRP